jgi:3-phosphoshikimate 1-carboxyvinyltransferase
VRLPGSKSMTNRALVLGALTAGRSVLRRPLRSDDTTTMVGALRSIGATVDTTDDLAWSVEGGQFSDSAGDVAVGAAGTVLRFTPPVAAHATAPIRFDGSEAIRRRPVTPLLTALRELGVRIDASPDDGLPFVVHGTGGAPGGRVTLDASSSSQLVSALLLAGATYTRGIDVAHVGSRAVPNAPHLAMTVEMLRARGVSVDVSPERWVVEPATLRAVDELIEPDLSSAAPFLAAAVVTAGAVTVPDWPARSTQPGALLPDLLERFGATATMDDDGLTVRGTGTIRGVDLDLRDAGELTPVLAALAALADSPSRLRGIDYLRGHETDRLAALARELGELGAEVQELDDGLEIRPRPLRGAVFSTYDDHRMAMAAAVVGLAVDHVRIENIETTAKTLPEFAELWAGAVRGAGATP